jgi:hypothetical protein
MRPASSSTASWSSMTATCFACSGITSPTHCPRSGQNPDSGSAASGRANGSQLQPFLHPKSGPYLPYPKSGPYLRRPYFTLVVAWPRAQHPRVASGRRGGCSPRTPWARSPLGTSASVKVLTRTGSFATSAPGPRAAHRGRACADRARPPHPRPVPRVSSAALPDCVGRVNNLVPSRRSQASSRRPTVVASTRSARAAPARLPARPTASRNRSSSQRSIGATPYRTIRSGAASHPFPWRPVVRMRTPRASRSRLGSCADHQWRFGRLRRPRACGGCA